MYRILHEKPQLMEALRGHTDKIMCVQFSVGHSVQLLSSSYDGSARVWKLVTATKWYSDVLRLPPDRSHQSTVSLAGSSKSTKLHVTIISWHPSDSFAFVAFSNFKVGVWQIFSDQPPTLNLILDWHIKGVFVLETHPTNWRYLLTAGHDGRIAVWDIMTGERLKGWTSEYDGEVTCVHDCRFSPDGFSMVSTDSYGCVTLYSILSDALTKNTPKEQFFSTDYVPLIWDVEHSCLDSDTHMPPHMMPPPYLVDADNVPLPPHQQNIILRQLKPKIDTYQVLPQKSPVNYQEVIRERLKQGNTPSLLMTSNSSQISNSGCTFSSSTGTIQHSEFLPCENLALMFSNPDPSFVCSSSQQAKTFATSSNVESSSGDNTAYSTRPLISHKTENLPSPASAGFSRIYQCRKKNFRVRPKITDQTPSLPGAPEYFTFPSTPTVDNSNEPLWDSLLSTPTRNNDVNTTGSTPTTELLIDTSNTEMSSIIPSTDIPALMISPTPCNMLTACDTSPQSSLPSILADKHSASQNIYSIANLLPKLSPQPQSQPQQIIATTPNSASTINTAIISPESAPSLPNYLTTDLTQEEIDLWRSRTIVPQLQDEQLERLDKLHQSLLERELEMVHNLSQRNISSIHSNNMDQEESNMEVPCNSRSKQKELARKEIHSLTSINGIMDGAEDVSSDESSDIDWETLYTARERRNRAATSR